MNVIMSKRELPIAILLANSMIIYAGNFRHPNSSTSQCPERDNCRTEDEKNIPSCYCDQKCFYYMDCCKAYVSENANNNARQFLHMHSCIPLTKGSHLIEEQIGAFMINSCLETNTLCNAAKEGPSAKLPVSTKDETYVNVECAMCNGVKDFQYWNAIYEIYNENDFEGIIEGNSSENVTLDFMEKGKADDIVMYLQPPENIEPRFCPVDIPRNKKDLKSNFYQNTVLCNFVLFKNTDTCKNVGCCIEFDYEECLQFYLPHYHKTELQRAGIETLQIMLAMDETKSTEETSAVVSEIELQAVFWTEEQNKFGNSTLSRKAWTLKYKLAKVPLFLELYPESNETEPDYDGCIQGLIRYIQNSVYKLEPLNRLYYVKPLLWGKEVFLDIFRSHELLTFAQMTSLFKLETEIECENSKSNTLILGKLRKTTAKDEFTFWLGYQESIIKRNSMLGPFSLLDPKMIELCKKLSLKLDSPKTSSRIFVHAECKEDKKLNPIINMSTKQNLCLLTYSIASFSFLILLKYF